VLRCLCRGAWRSVRPPGGHGRGASPGLAGLVGAHPPPPTPNTAEGPAPQEEDRPHQPQTGHGARVPVCNDYWYPAAHYPPADCPKAGIW
jgi:hypothetical protein